ncbi:hypothetical protein C1752_03305 [Acaryochloris thomasi RCC1774]|uniref:Uncharacterized protein n=1 Tax=Acaryochloris thomasi RCC1774 TaxID=1764569 RepID=A0A2W1JSI7_9CYAN|nr:hypothetical protein [Acaryochloris thomasi]PZD72874.1 hypothetical protein C1752_03305 [Acaryochloris thomasi RCC1774]
MRFQPALSIALFCSCTVAVIDAQAIAQTSTDLQSPQRPIFEQNDSDDASDLFSDRATGSSLLDLMNRLQQAGGRSASEFAEEQNESFNEAVDAFRQQQQQDFGGPEATPETPKPAEP